MDTPFHRLSRRWLAQMVGGLLWLGLLMPVVGYAQPVQPVAPEVEAAILHEDWSAVVNLLGRDGALPAPGQFVRAHAFLALNRNNDSLCLFLQNSSADHLRQWDTWTQALVSRHARTAIAHYFRGDALARQEQWDAALQSFNVAIGLNPHHALALNARGVIYAARGQWNAALVDFAAAAMSFPTFADAYASRGAMYIQKKAGGQGALKGFAQALQHSPDFGLAMAGRGAAKFALRQWDEAQRDFAAAQQQTACVSGMVEENLVRLAQYMQGSTGGIQLAQLADDEAGTPIDKRFEDFKNDPSQKNTNRFIDGLRGQSPAVQEQYIQKAKDYAAPNPHWGNTANNRVDTVKDWDKPGGWGELFSRAIPKDAGVTVKGTGGKIGGVDLQGHQLNVTQQNFDIANRLQNALGPERPMGGVTTNLGKAHIDEGDWPVVAHYGLLYRVQPHEPAAAEKGGKQ